MHAEESSYTGVSASDDHQWLIVRQANLNLGWRGQRWGGEMCSSRSLETKMKSRLLSPRLEATQNCQVWNRWTLHSIASDRWRCGDLGTVDSRVAMAVG